MSVYSAELLSQTFPLHASSHLTQLAHEAGTMTILILPTTNLRFREIKQLIQVHPASK